MSEEDLTNYKTYINNFDITKHIILDKENNYWYSAEYVDKMLKKQDKEIERLSNIINELEKWLVEWREMLDCPDFYEYGIINCINDTLTKLQVLKGSDK